MAERIQLRRTKGWRIPKGAVNVARPTKWGNPYPVEILGRERAVSLFTDEIHGVFNPSKLDGLTDEDLSLIYDRRRHWRSRLPDPLHAAYQELAGHDLACWCKLSQLCHADVLLVIANQRTPTPVDPRKEKK